MSWENLVTVAVYGGLISSALFTIDYMRAVDIRSSTGRHILAFSAALMIIFGTSVVRRLFFPNSDWVHFSAISLLVVDFLLFNQWRLMRRARRFNGEGRRRHDD